MLYFDYVGSNHPNVFVVEYSFTLNNALFILGDVA